MTYVQLLFKTIFKMGMGAQIIICNPKDVVNRTGLVVTLEII